MGTDSIKIVRRKCCLTPWKKIWAGSKKKESKIDPIRIHKSVILHAILAKKVKKMLLPCNRKVHSATIEIKIRLIFTNKCFHPFLDTHFLNLEFLEIIAPKNLK